ncbi:type II toxin-antitoxin system RelE/ParE family toxin [Pseudomonas rhizosphaerae]|uniref:type II toxin-antitoxin system RelE/ParE family toxin n=1 Tax=Pseudomonas rhizosphaerae TaxID=216142 RepID=UPI001785C5D8|nr:type II toxin-antitoxin system RelE/ParE family toxin [Pseudomonas rhizosphaerae]MBD8613404.1 type II toxin-antitoxin system RelE/ParE family toxin [Pseudomonas putida]MEB2871299.1 type II toxin-antitoxin system RelE/ParE family toxin [Pseudomonas rhizosphaerae]
MIRSFACADTEALFTTGRTRRWPDIKQVAERKLAALDAANELRDLRSPPGNRLHSLEGDRRGQHSISINMQWRVCFTWTESGPENVEIVDYH